MKEEEWNNIKTNQPKTFGWYAVKTIHGEAEAPFVHNAGGELIWVLPDPSIITHWKERKIKI